MKAKANLKFSNHMWDHILEMAALRRLRQENCHMIEASLAYIVIPLY